MERPPSVENSRGAYSIRSFCECHDISRSMYYQLKRQGKGPREFKAGERVLISVESAAKWRRKLEKATGEGNKTQKSNDDQLKAGPAAATA